MKVFPLLLLLVLCGLLQVSDTLAEREPVSIAGSKWVADAPTKVADGLGLFNEGHPGPPIRVDNLDSGKDALASLIEGDSTFALAASTPIAKSLLDWHLAQVPADFPQLAILASVSQSNRTHVVIADGTLGIERPADLAGKRVGVMLDTSGHFGWTRFLQFHGLDPSDITLVDLPVDEHMEAMKSGRIDASVLWEPWASRLREFLGDDARLFTTRHLYAVNWLLVTRHDVLVSHPALASRVLNAYRNATRFIDSQPVRAREIHAKASTLDAQAIEQLETGIIWSVGLNWAVLADLEAQFEWLASRRGLPVQATPAPYDYLVAAPLSDVAPRRITLPSYFFRDMTTTGDTGNTR